MVQCPVRVGRDVSDDTGGGRLPMGAVVAVGAWPLLVLVAIGCLLATVSKSASVSVTLVCGRPCGLGSSRKTAKKVQCQLVTEAAALLVGEPVNPPCDPCSALVDKSTGEEALKFATWSCDIGSKSTLAL